MSGGETVTVNGVEWVLVTGDDGLLTVKSAAGAWLWHPTLSRPQIFRNRAAAVAAIEALPRGR